jgi:hypothetical protein
MALPNKLFEYLQARLPLVVSDVPAMASFVREHGIGDVYVTGDAVDLAKAALRVLDSAADLRRPFDVPGFVERFSWEPQADVLRGVYAELLGPLDEVGPDLPMTIVRNRKAEGTFVEIGPANMAGQAWEWARALERAQAATRAEALVVDAGLKYPVDVEVTADQFARDNAWQQERQRTALDTWTHAVFEAGRPLLGTLHGKDFVADAALLERHGIRTAMVLHGSEIRSPRRHRILYDHSPFRDTREPFFDLLQQKADQLAPLIAKYDGPKLVTTHDLFDEVPEARWLPVCIDHERWALADTPLERERPVVVHIPSNPMLKGSALIEPAVQELHDKGLIEYRRLEKVPPAHMPAVLADADVVLDHFVMGNYGVLSIQAMAMGRVTVCHVHERVRARAPQELPIVEADPSSIGEVLERIVHERSWAQTCAARGRDFTTRWHDGRASADVLADVLGLEKQ